MSTHYYSELPLPLGGLPRPGSPVTDSHITDIACPMLRAVSAGLTALAEAAFHSAVDNHEVHHATVALIFQAELVLHILERWQDERGGVEPCTLHSKEVDA